MSLSALLMGVANRAGEVKRRDEQRNYQWEMVGKQAQSEDLLKQIEDPSLPDTDRQELVNRFEDLHKLPKGSGHFAVSMHKPLQRMIQQQAPQLAPSVEQQQMPSAPAAPAPAATEPVAGGGGRLGNVPAMPTNEQQPLQALPRATPTLGMPPSPPPSMQPPNTELGRRQQQGHELMKQNMDFVHSLGLSPEDEKLAVQHLLNIPPAVQSAIIGGQSRENVQKMKSQTDLMKMAAGGKTVGQFATYQVPGQQPRSLFRVVSGPNAGQIFENGKQTMLEPNEVQLAQHPDKVEAIVRPNGDLEYHNITQELGGEKSVNLGQGSKPSASGGTSDLLSPEGLSLAVDMFAKTGQMPSLGMGGKGIRKQIIDEAGKRYPKLDLASNRAEFMANQASLTQMQKNRDAVVTWEGTARKNLDVFQKSAKSIIDSGSPLINIPLRLAAQKAKGSAEMAAFNAARTIALTEIAKVLNNPNLTGQLTNEARTEVEGLSPTNATLGQIYSVVNILKQDMKNRHDELDSTIDSIKGRIGGGGSTSKASATPPPPPVGTVMSGYRFKGGDASDKKNWDKVQ